MRVRGREGSTNYRTDWFPGERGLVDTKGVCMCFGGYYGCTYVFGGYYGCMYVFGGY